MSATASTFDPLSEQLVVAAREREATTLSRAERATYWTSTAAFVLFAALLAAVGGGSLPDLWVVVLLVSSCAVASRLEFEVGSTLAIATELILVEMLFTLPPAQLPIWVALGGLLGQLPEYVRRTVSLERTTIVVGSSWYAFGPALVFTLVPVHASMVVDDQDADAHRMIVAHVTSRVSQGFHRSSAESGKSSTP